MILQGAWDEINGRIKGRARMTQKLPVKKDLENGDWEDAADSIEEQVTEKVGKLRVDDSRSPVAVVDKVERDIDEDDIIP